jgi:aryl-alcohol dehydrogenase-like predicted oxidoreductase
MYKKPVSAPAPEQPAAAAGTLQIGDALVRRMGFGARWVTIHAPDTGSQVLRRALELGVNLIDTADVYGGDNASEQLLAEALHPYPADLMIATKGGQKSVDGSPVPDGRPEYLRQACERSLRALRVDTIDLYQLHNLDPEVPLEESLGALVQLRDEGKIRHIGVSNVFRDLLDVALSAAPVVSVQNRYSLRHRESDPEVEVCRRRGIAFMPWTPLGMGDLSGIDALERVASARGETQARIALAWLLQRSETMLPIPGTSSIAHLEENVRATELQLTDDEMRLLTAPGAE